MEKKKCLEYRLNMNNQSRIENNHGGLITVSKPDFFTLCTLQEIK